MAKSVAIDFSGVMMFVLYDDLIEVLIPNCEPGHLPPDGVKAVPHWAWLTSPTPGRGVKYELREALIGSDIEIRGDTHGERVLRGLNYVFRLNDVVVSATGGRPPNRDPRKAEDRQFVATRIRLYGGALIARGVSKKDRCAHDFKGQKLISPKRLIWQSQVPDGADQLEAKVKLGNGATRRIGLRPASKIAIWNLDYRVPEDWKPVETAADEDNDFRWNYHAYGLSARVWAPVMKRNRLPVPRILDGPKTVSGCNCRACLLDLRTKRPTGGKRTRR